MTNQDLEAVRQAYEQRRQADRESAVALREAIRQAVIAGHSYGEIGRVLGVTRQAARQLVER